MITKDCRASTIGPDARLRKLLAHAWNASRFYRELYTERGIREEDLAHIALEDLPVVSKADLMVQFDEAVTDSRLRKVDLQRWLRDDFEPLNLYLDEYIIVHGSGGTNLYSYVPYTLATWHETMAAAAPLLLPPDSPAAPLRNAFYFWMEGHYVGATTARFASHAAHEALSLSVFDPEEEVCARLNAFQPQRLTSYASALDWLAEWALEGKLRIEPRAVLSSGDRLTPAIRARLKAAWNAEIYDLYGACESVCIAVQRPEGQEFEVLAESNVVEVVDPANRMVPPGERGRVLLTSLTNATLPIIRFDLRDYAILGSTGLGAATIRRLEGKSYHALPVRMADGSLGALEVYELAEMELPGVEKIQFVARGPSAVEIRYKSTQDLDAQLREAFRRLLARKAAAVESLAVHRVDRLANSVPAFKLECVVKPDQKTFTPPRLQDDVRGSKPVTTAPADLTQSERGADAAASIDALYGRVASRHPERLAALDGDRSLSYAQLDAQAARVAGNLVRRGFDPTRPVALFCPHRLEVLPLIVGVVRAGGFYLPLDPHLPIERLRTILIDAGAELLLTTAAQKASALELADDSARVDCIEEIDAPPSEGRARSAADPACLLYTSGSTAGPKGVVLSDRTIRERAAHYARDSALQSADRLTLLQPYSASASVREIFGALTVGATLCFYDVRDRGVAGLAHWLDDSAVTVFYAVPTLFRAFVETLSAETFASVRTVRLGGEPVRAEDVEGFRRHFPPPCRLVNGYAATETDTICTQVIKHDTPIVAGRVPAGAPASGTAVTICDEQGRAVAGALGEVRVTSPMLAAGYWDARRCAVVPFDLPFPTGDLGYRVADGRLFLLGRRDLIVKIHGHRIDLAEVERAAGAVAGIVEAAAIARPAEQGGSTIVVFYAADDAASNAPLRRAVASVVPPRVASTTFVRLATLPRLPGGKVNRASLLRQPVAAPEPPAEATAYASDTERILGTIWRAVLNVPAVARSANFFDAGGDSITAFRMLTGIEETFGVELPIGELFAHAELSALAEAIDARRPR